MACVASSGLLKAKWHSLQDTLCEGGSEDQRRLQSEATRRMVGARKVRCNTSDAT